jgi:hypothetical protein
MYRFHARIGRLACGTHMTYRFHSACSTLRRDPGHLPARDRAVLRILNRSQAATAAQLATAAYHDRYVAQVRLRRLWDLGYLERILLPPAHAPSGAPYAYRLSSACLRRLGYQRRLWRGPGYLAHTLDAVEAVCALVARSDPETEPLVTLWLPESIVDDGLLTGPSPDTIVVMDADTGSGVLCLEVDEATQHVAPIRDKLRAYRRALADRPMWHLVFVVPTAARQTWLRRIARDEDVGSASAWVIHMDDLRRGGVDARLLPIVGSTTSTLREILADPRPRRSETPVGSRAWLELLGSGGGEEADALLR